MTRKQKLRNAVILGLLMSSVTASSAWADVVLVEGDLYPEGLICINKEETYNGTGKDIVMNHHHETKWPAHGSYGFWVHAYDDGALIKHGAKAIINVGSISIDSRNYVESTVNGERLSVGLLAGNEKVGFEYPAFGTDEYEAVIDLNADNGVKISSLTRNSANSYGIFSKKNGTVDVSSENGNISINSSKSLAKKYILGIYSGKIADTDYSSAVYGVSAVDGKVSLNAKAGNIVIDSYIEDVSNLAEEKNFQENFEELQHGNIYGVSNINGTVNLIAGEAIIISANSANGDAYGIYADSDKETVLNGKVNIIEAVADGTGKAVGITAENGSKVNITGDAFVSGDDGALVIKGNNNDTIPLVYGQYQITVDGNLQASAQDGAAIHVTQSGNMYVTGDVVFDTDANDVAAGMIIDSGKESKVDGSVIGSAENTNGVIVQNGSVLTAGKNVQVSSGEKALIVEQGSAADFNGDAGVNMLYGKNGALDAQGDVIFASNAIFVADDTAAVNVNVKNTNLKVDGYVVAQGGKIGLNAVSDKIYEIDKAVLGKDGGTNYIIAQDTALNAENMWVELHGDGILAGSTAANIINGAGFLNYGNLTVQGGKYGINADNAGYVHVSGNAVIEAVDKDGTALNAVGNNESSRVAIDGDAVIVSNGSVGANIENAGVVISGETYIAGQETGLKIQHAKNSSGYYTEFVKLGKEDGINYITAANTAVDLSGDLIMNGESYFYASDKNGAAVNVQAGSRFENNGAVQVQGGQYGFIVDNSIVSIEGGDGDNYFVSTASREDGNLANTDDEFSNAVNVSNGAQFTATGRNNILAAGEIEDGYGKETAISAFGGTAELTAAVNNELHGAIYANKGTVKLSAQNGDNIVLSSTHGRTAGGDDSGIHLVSALYAAEGSNIGLSAENGVNRIYSSYEFVEGHEEDREITIWAEDGGSVNLNGAVEIVASNGGDYTSGLKNNSLGIAVSAGGRVITADDKYADGTLKAFDGELSTVNVNYGSYVSDSRIVGDIVAGYGGAINIAISNLLSDESFTRGNRLTVQGNILAANGGIANVDLGKGGLWIGRADDYQDASNGHTTFYNPAFSNEILDSGKVNVSMGEGSQWILTGQSWISSLKADNAYVDMTATDAVSNEKYTHSLVIDDYQGTNTTFRMDFDTENHQLSDMLYIAGGAGDYNVSVADVLDEKILLEEGLRIATVSDGISVGSVVYDGTAFKRVYYATHEEEFDKNSTTNGEYNDGQVNGSAPQPLDEVQENDYNTGKPGNDFINDKFDANDKNIVIDGIETTENSVVGDTVIAMSRVNYSNAVYMDRFNKRMGEARFIDGDEGVWVRARHDRIGKEHAFRSQNTMYELGYDVKQANDGGENRFGFAIDYMDGETSYSNIGGTGEISRKGIWMYDSWLGNKGHYTDFIAKWGHLSNDFDIIAADGTGVQGDYSNNVFSFSAEYGKKNDMGNNWYFEPQAQLQYAHVTGADYVTSAGTEVSLDGIDSLIARAGFRLGKDLSDHSTVYFKGDVLHEFMGDQDLYVKDASYNGSAGYENDGTWYDLGFGFAVKVNQASYAYLDFEKSFGNDNDETYQINAGMQWSF